MTAQSSAPHAPVLEKPLSIGPSSAEIAAYALAAGKRRGLTSGELAEVMAERFARVADVRCPARPVLDAVVASFAGAERDIHLDCAPSLEAPIAELVPIAIAASEAISNALTHAFPADREGRIWVKFTEDEERRTLTVRDNGVGFPDLDPDPASGRGLLHALARQLDGYARLGSAPFGGALVSVVYPHPTAAAWSPAQITRGSG